VIGLVEFKTVNSVCDKYTDLLELNTHNIYNVLGN